VVLAGQRSTPPTLVARRRALTHLTEPGDAHRFGYGRGGQNVGVDRGSVSPDGVLADRTGG
jgi:hypothetical protein